MHLNFCLEMVLSAQSYRIMENKQISMLRTMQTMDAWLVKFQKEVKKKTSRTVWVILNRQLALENVD